MHTEARQIMMLVLRWIKGFVRFAARSSLKLKGLVYRILGPTKNWLERAPRTNSLEFDDPETCLYYDKLNTEI